MSKIGLILILASSFALSACSSAKVREQKKLSAACATLDWWEIGRKDGVSGVGLKEGLKVQAERCRGTSFPLVSELYLNGRDTGLIDYCTPDHGLTEDHKRPLRERVCPTYLDAKF